MRKGFDFRNEDGSLRLDELLGEQHVRHYTKILSSSSAEFSAMQLRMDLGMADPQEDQFVRWTAEPAGQRVPEGYLTRVAESRPAVASSCAELALRPDWSWDVCGYYRLLGVHWRATVKDLRNAYNLLDPAQEDDAAFYALTQLLDAPLRLEYDLTPLGGVFFGDRDVQIRLKRAAARVAAARNAAAHAAGEYYDPIAAKDEVLGEWGIVNYASAEEAREHSLDHARRRGAPPPQFRAGSDSGALGGSAGLWERSWGYWLLDGPVYEAAPDPGPEVMEKWQRKVAKALRRAGRGRVPFGVGAWNGDDPITLRLDKQGCIFFLSGSTANRKLAEYAVREAIALGHV